MLVQRKLTVCPQVYIGDRVSINLDNGKYANMVGSICQIREDFARPRDNRFSLIDMVSSDTLCSGIPRKHATIVGRGSDFFEDRRLIIGDRVRVDNQFHNNKNKQGHIYAMSKARFHTKYHIVDATVKCELEQLELERSALIKQTYSQLTSDPALRNRYSWYLRNTNPIAYHNALAFNELDHSFRQTMREKAQKEVPQRGRTTPAKNS